MMSNTPELKPEAVHIWPTNIDQFLNKLDDFKAVLTKEEYQRAQRYRFEKDRHSFIISRGRLRTLLEQYTGIPAQLLRLSCNEYGKPFIDETHHQLDPRMYFNVSHSHGYIIYAFGLTPFIGIDIEHMKNERSLHDLAKRCYTENELSQYFSSENSVETFYKLWSHKEAYLKAIGTGLSTSLKNFEISLGDKPHSDINEVICFDRNMNWYATDLRLFDHYQAALVTNFQVKDLQIFAGD